MSLPLILLLLLVSATFLQIGKRRAGYSFILLTALLVILIGTGVLPRLLLNQLQTYDHVSRADWKSKNAIVVLGLGTVRWPDSEFVSTHALGCSRIQEAARLYSDCKRAERVCQILTSGGDPSNTGRSEAAIMARELEDLNVNKSDVIIEGESQNTFQNAQFSSELLRKANFDQVYLVTSGTT